MDNTEPCISIVLPVYNVARYLETCLNSILGQTYKNWELVVVNDGSTDTSAQICLEYATKYAKQIKYVEQNNGGLSAARNTGMQYASGDYAVFIDSDDVVSPCFIEYLVEGIKSDGCDISLCKLERIKEQRVALIGLCNQSHLSIRHLNKNQSITSLLADDIPVCGVAKLAPVEMWKNCPFPEGMLHEDVATTYMLLDKSNDVAVIDEPLYGHVIREGSISHISSMSDKRCEDFCKAIEDRTAYIAKHHTELENKAIARLMADWVCLLDLIRRSGDESPIQNKIRSNIMLRLRDRKMRKALRDGTLKQRFKVYLYLFSPILYGVLRQQRL